MTIRIQITRGGNFGTAELKKSGYLVHFALSRLVTPLGESLTRRHATDVIVENETRAQQGALTGGNEDLDWNVRY